MIVRIKINLNDTTKELQGILNDDVILYQDDNCSTKLFLKEKKLVRENDVFKLSLEFDNQTGYYHLKKENINLCLNLKVELLEYNLNYFKVSYLIETEKIDYEMRVLNDN